MSRLICRSDRCRSRLMGSTSRLRIPRSRKLTISAVAKIATAYHACRGRGHGALAGVTSGVGAARSAMLNSFSSCGVEQLVASRSLSIRHGGRFLLALTPPVLDLHAFGVRRGGGQRRQNGVEFPAQFGGE